MDSANSGSMQSSSGGDEEYDSRAESISVFLSNSNPPGHVGPMSNPPPPHHHHHHHQQTHHSSSSSMFDPLSNYFDPLSRSSPLANPNSMLNLDMVWSKNVRSEPNCTDLGGFMASSSSPTQQLLTNQAQGRATFSSMQVPQGPESVATKGSVSGSVSGTNEQTNSSSSNINNNSMVRNPKKRSRASRRAPTTVLTTDTTNFRAMVQEFTGIPAPPFTSSPFPRSRLDLFGTASTMRSPHLDPSPPPYLLRPFAQKLQQPPPFLSPSSSSSTSPSFPPTSMVDAIASTAPSNINAGTATNTTSNSTSINYQLPPDLGLLKQPQNVLNISMQQSPILNFQSLFQAPPKYPVPNSAVLGTKPQGSLDIPTADSHLKMGTVLEDFGLSHGHVSTNLSGLHNIVSSDGTTTLPRSDNNPAANWGDGVGSNEGDQDLLRSINGNYNNSQQQHHRVTNGKMNYPASSDFHGDKGPENVTVTRTEGMVESWICSSD